MKRGRSQQPATPVTGVKAPKAAKVKAENAAAAAKAAAKAEAALNPYPTFMHPTTAEVRAVHDGLMALHPEVLEVKAQKKADTEGGCGDRTLVLDALVGTILSQNTTDVNSHRAFMSLKAAFPTWEAFRTAPSSTCEDSIRQGGLAATKTARIKLILEALLEERGELSLEFMREMSTEDIKAKLRTYKGVGAKTISCVLLFCLHRADFPVDTHVWKIALALGWVPKSADRDGTYAHLNARVPDELKYALHVLLVEHGKVYKNGVAELKKMASTVSAMAATSGEMVPECASTADVKVKREPTMVD